MLRNQISIPLVHRLGLCAITVGLLVGAQTVLAYPALFAYGDSLSDTGNNPSPAPQYFNGRWSNGSVWVEYLSVKLGFAYNPSNNYAYAGTTTSNLASQVSLTPASTNLQAGLCTIWSGGNDFLHNLNSGVYDDAGWSNVIQSAIGNLTNAVAGLYAKGARNILVCNLPDLGKTPFLLGAYSSAYQAYISSKVVLFNSGLASALAQAGQGSAGLHLYPLDVNSCFGSLLSSAGALGFTVTTVGALADANLTDKSFTGPGSDYLFWDPIHPTTKAHNLIADWAYQALPDAPRVTLAATRSGTNLNVALENLTPAFTYLLQSSTDLYAWSEYQTFVSTGTNQTIAVTIGSGPRTFFRARY
ncbi:exported hypothetical protein [Verrucomicrobia bacterium]|nr:exported hypothetical protein [Verrucomicrobiota bacterium]